MKVSHLNWSNSNPHDWTKLYEAKICIVYTPVITTMTLKNWFDTSLCCSAMAATAMLAG